MEKKVVEPHPYVCVCDDELEYSEINKAEEALN